MISQWWVEYRYWIFGVWFGMGFFSLWIRAIRFDQIYLAELIMCLVFAPLAFICELDDQEVIIWKRRK